MESRWTGRSLQLSFKRRMILRQKEEREANARHGACSSRAQPLSSSRRAMARRSARQPRLLRQLESSRLSSTLRRRLACASLSASDASSMQSASQRSSSALALRVGRRRGCVSRGGIFSWRVKVGTRGRSRCPFLGSAEKYLRRAGPGSMLKPPSSSACISSSSNSSAVGKGEGRSRVGAQERVRSASEPARYARARGDVEGARHVHSRRRHGRGWSHRARRDRSARSRVRRIAPRDCASPEQPP